MSLDRLREWVDAGSPRRSIETVESIPDLAGYGETKTCVTLRETSDAGIPTRLTLEYYGKPRVTRFVEMYAADFYSRRNTETERTELPTLESVIDEALKLWEDMHSDI